MRRAFVCLVLIVFSAALASAQSLPVKWEELTAGDFQKAIGKAQGTCVLPIGVVEKHGPHLPMGTDLINVRYRAVHAAEQEYAVVFPEYYFGQIAEATHEPGTLSYSPRLQMDLLQETASEMGRNGCKKVLVVNGHGGNVDLLRYFVQTQLYSQRPYVLYVWLGRPRVSGRPAMKSSFDMHAGEGETLHVMVSRPDLVHLDRAGTQSGADQKRLGLPDGLLTPIWWYARFPEHYAGDAAAANKALGEFDMKAEVDSVAAVIRAVKTDQDTARIQREFFEKTTHPVDTKQ